MSRAIVINETTVQGFSAEQELQSLAEKEEWELILKSDAFLNRSGESKVQLFQLAINQRIQLVRKSLPSMLNKGEKQRAAAMTLSKRFTQAPVTRFRSLKRLA